MVSWLELPVWANAAIFAVAAAGVWFAGTRLSAYAGAIAERTGAGKAFVGALLLGGITSLPEVVTTSTAAAFGDAALAANNIFGGVAMQVVVLAAADFAIGRRPLSAVTASSSVLMQGALLVFVLALAAAGILIGDAALLPFGLWTPAIFGVSLFGFYIIHHYGTDIEWVPVAEVAERPAARGDTSGRDAVAKLSMRRIVLYTVASAVGITVAGFVVARAAGALAEQTGLGSGFVGVALLPVATSLPEITTTLAAARMGQYEMAFSNVYGANLLDVALLFLIDLIYTDGPVLNALGDFSLFGALLGVLVTTTYLGGLIERREKTIGRLGLDSAAVLVLYAAGLVALYMLR